MLSLIRRKAKTLLCLIVENGILILLRVVLDRLVFYSLYLWLYKLCFASYGSNIRFGRHGLFRCIPSDVRFCGVKDIYLGDNVRIDHGVYIHCQNNSEGLFINGGVRINRDVHIEVGAKIQISDYALIAPSVLISSSKHNYSNLNLPIAQQGGSNTSPIYVGSGAWLCERSVVLGGSRIGRNSVVVSNVVVRGMVPDHSLYVCEEKILNVVEMVRDK